MSLGLGCLAIPLHRGTAALDVSRVTRAFRARACAVLRGNMAGNRVNPGASCWRATLPCRRGKYRIYTCISRIRVPDAPLKNCPYFLGCSLTKISYTHTRCTPTFETQFWGKMVRLTHGWIRYQWTRLVNGVHSADRRRCGALGRVPGVTRTSTGDQARFQRGASRVSTLKIFFAPKVLCLVGLVCS